MKKWTKLSAVLLGLSLPCFSLLAWAGATVKPGMGQPIVTPPVPAPPIAALPAPAPPVAAPPAAPPTEAAASPTPAPAATSPTTPQEPLARVAEDLISGLTVSESDGLLLVKAVRAGSVAQQAGLHVGDVIVSVNKRQDLTLAELVTLLGAQAGQHLEFSVKRAGEAKITVLAIMAP